MCKHKRARQIMMRMSLLIMQTTLKVSKAYDNLLLKRYLHFFFYICDSTSCYIHLIPQHFANDYILSIKERLILIFIHLQIHLMLHETLVPVLSHIIAAINSCHIPLALFYSLSWSESYHVTDEPQSRCFTSNCYKASMLETIL